MRTMPPIAVPRGSPSERTLLPADVMRATATITKSNENTTGKYPEYHRVWEDDAFDVVAVFGKEFDDERAEDGGVQAYGAFLAEAEKYVTSLDAAATIFQIGGFLAAVP